MQGEPAVPGEVIHDEVLPARAYWHKRLSKGTALRIVDLEGCQAVDTLIYDAADTAIRYNAANTMKLCGNFMLGAAIEAMAEAFTLAQKSGLDRQQAR